MPLIEKNSGVVDGMFKELEDRNRERRTTYLRAVPFADAITARTDVGERTKIAIVMQALMAYQKSKGHKLPGVEEDKRMIGREVAEQNMGKQAEVLGTDLEDSAETMGDLMKRHKLKKSDVLGRTWEQVADVINKKPVRKLYQKNMGKQAFSIPAEAEQKAVQVATKLESFVQHSKKFGKPEIAQKYEQLANRKWRQAALFASQGKKATAPDPWGLESGGTGKFQETTPISEVPKTLQSPKAYHKSIVTRGATGALMGATGSALVWQFLHKNSTDLPLKAMGYGALGGAATLAAIRAAKGKVPVEDWNKKAGVGWDVHGYTADPTTYEKKIDKRIPKEKRWDLQDANYEKMLKLRVGEKKNFPTNYKLNEYIHQNYMNGNYGEKLTDNVYSAQPYSNSLSKPEFKEFLKAYQTGATKHIENIKAHASGAIADQSKFIQPKKEFIKDVVQTSTLGAVLGAAFPAAATVQAKGSLSAIRPKHLAIGALVGGVALGGYKAISGPTVTKNRNARSRESYQEELKGYTLPTGRKISGTAEQVQAFVNKSNYLLKNPKTKHIRLEWE